MDRHSFTPEEFDQLRSHWAPEELAVYERRMAGPAAPTPLHFDATQYELLRAVLRLLVPQQEGIDVAGFFDEQLEHSLGRGDRRPGLPPERELILAGLAALDSAARQDYNGGFNDIDMAMQIELLRRAQRGELKGESWPGGDSKPFFRTVLNRAVHAYYCHPRAWMRIGFPGAAYPEGYVWIDHHEVPARHERKTGWDRL